MGQGLEIYCIEEPIGTLENTPNNRQCLCVYFKIGAISHDFSDVFAWHNFILVLGYNLWSVNSLLKN